MSKQEFVLEAQARADTGKGASRRLRNQQDAIPAIVYGGDTAPVAITVPHSKMFHAIENDTFFSSIINLKIDGVSQSVVIKDMQRHPSKPRIMHADFLRVQADHLLTVKVPLHFLNETTAVGVKAGGIVSRLITELEVSCLPKDLPATIEVDLAKLAMGQSLHISSLNLPAGVSSISLGHGPEGDLGVVTIIPPQKSEEPADDDDAAADDDEKK